LNRRPKGDIQNIRQWAKPRGRVDILDVAFVFSSPAQIGRRELPNGHRLQRHVLYRVKREEADGAD
jgi:hypothetical protein